MEIDLKQLRELMRAMKQLDVHELEIQHEDQRIYLRRGPEQVAHTMASSGAAMGSIPPPPSVMPHALSAPPPDAARAGKSEEDADSNIVFITSPFVGTFYRSPGPDAGPFVDAGTKINPGQVLCIVEAMKLMNEIEAEISGTIVEVMAENGKPVEFGDRLFKVKTR
jgi:acetyl-CoA carboxylase biotin carboxyl carrier protein